MKIVGLTGGIGSGKTTVAREFEKLGVPVYIADQRSKLLLNTDSAVIEQVKQLLGDKVYTVRDGKIQANRKLIATVVFSDKGALQSLNAILHPAVQRDFKNWLKKVHHSYVIYEAAILLDSGPNFIVDEVLLVTASLKTRVDRVVKRDKISRKDVYNRILNQSSELYKLELSNYVIQNKEFAKIPLLVSNIHDFLLKN
ncbi:MAG: dephospho-CoA kinase [Nonlabens sp.]